jgi:putative ABC transport system ATP-binding protein
MVVVSSLRYQYGSDKALSFPDFSVEKGKTCLLLGNSGSGKTTLLHLMGGLLKIQQGKVEISDQDLSQLTESQADMFRGKYMGFIFQRDHLISALSVKKNLLMAPFLANIKQDEIRVDEVLSELGLRKKKHSRVRDLSQGQVQRVAIARAVLNKPAVLFADEPTSALDDYNCDRVIHLLLSVSEQNQCTLVVATHDQRLKSIFSRQVQIQNQ